MVHNDVCQYQKCQREHMSMTEGKRENVRVSSWTQLCQMCECSYLRHEDVQRSDRVGVWLFCLLPRGTSAASELAVVRVGVGANIEVILIWLSALVTYCHLWGVPRDHEKPSNTVQTLSKWERDNLSARRFWVQ